MSARPNRCRFALATLVLVAAAAGGIRAQPASLPKTSPFLPPAGQGSAGAPSASENIEFAGVSSVGKRTDLVFHDKAAKKSHWIGIGETKEGIAVLNYDAQREQAVVKLNGVEKVLSLRKVAVAAKGPPGVPTPIVPTNPAPPGTPVVFAPPPPPPTPATPAAEAPVPATTAPAAPPGPLTPAEVQRKQETEARMLVSDLLEIGMAQRKAYEDAQRRATDGNAAPATPPDAPKP